MAETIISTILPILGNYYAEDIKAFKSVKEDLSSMSQYFKDILAVVQDAEEKQFKNESIKSWISSLKDVAYDIDDLFDEMAFEDLKRRVIKGHKRERMRYRFSRSHPVFYRFDLSRKLKALRKTLDEVALRKNELSLTERSFETQGAERDLFYACSYVNAPTIKGRDEDKKEILSRLYAVEDVVRLSVLPIFGMGGIGKTALAKLVMGDVKGFDRKAWACVSDKFDIQKLLQDIFNNATGESVSNNTLEQLIPKLQNVLRGQKFFLLLDDIWVDKYSVWKEVYDILDVGNKGSVVLVTTRTDLVASITKTMGPYNVDKLSKSVCCALFRKFAFEEGEEQTHPRLNEDDMVEAIVDKCGGIPLVVKTLGSLLRTVRDEREWLRIKNLDTLTRLGDEYNDHYGTVKLLLKLSYDKLPAYMKPCFTQLSLYPKATVYAAPYEFYFWRALGFSGAHHEIKEIRALERSCLGLISRSMLQDVERTFDGMIFRFKVHDLLHDLAREIVGEELAAVTPNEQDLQVSELCRYIAYNGRVDLSKLPEQLSKAKKVRSLTFCFTRCRLSQFFLKGIISNMTRLRTLALGNNQFEELPSSIGKLKHLRFLDLSHNILLKSLPDTMCELLNLECLLLQGCKQLGKLPQNIDRLVNLRCLFWTSCHTDGKELSRLPSLRHLVMDDCKELTSLWDNHNAGCLTSLGFLGISECPKLSSLPESMNRLVDLEKLYIVKCEKLDLKQGEALSGLHKLESLEFTQVPMKSLCLPKGMDSAAKSLRYFCIQNCQDLTKLPDWLQSFTSLEKLFIWNCPHLSVLPDKFPELKSLQQVSVKNCPVLSQKLVEAAARRGVSSIMPQIVVDGRPL